MEKVDSKEETKTILQQLEWLEISEDNNLIPGLACTAAALSVGLKDFLKGDNLRAQIMMRYRVGMHIFTVFCMISGLVYDQHLKSKEGTDA